MTLRNAGKYAFHILAMCYVFCLTKTIHASKKFVKNDTRLLLRYLVMQQVSTCVCGYIK